MGDGIEGVGLRFVQAQRHRTKPNVGACLMDGGDFGRTFEYPHVEAGHAGGREVGARHGLHLINGCEVDGDVLLNRIVVHIHLDDGLRDGLLRLVVLGTGGKHT